ncbi:DUF2158 domain-containing protein [Silvanigrella paludirubra]|uniref:DUF2158 domain-containing protein n=1 Tax=Silvanigrella paludirubra TaxID=2499159 RepID=A0A6N6VU83_9BACT|nr:DUF2158 domain-containing protein [Silvanigrella paludirubra]KAB8039116.1 DUF2158 domain-containing protein [Silvanigrella paludirubra]
MSSNDFKIGDVVELKSGSEPMTVVGIGISEFNDNKTFVHCNWFNKVSDFPENISFASNGNYSSHQIGSTSFPPEALKKVNR